MNLIKIKVPVTQKHLNKGLSSSFQFCSIAEAMKDVFTGTLFGVWDDSIEFICSYRVFLPPSVVLAIKTLDQDGKIEPFEFELEVDQDRFCKRTQNNISKYITGPTPLEMGLLPEQDFITNSVKWDSPNQSSNLNDDSIVFSKSSGPT